jgi:protease IV
MRNPGRYAGLLEEQRRFTEDEAALFDEVAAAAYESFRNKAAESRGMSIEAMQVRSGTVASGKGLRAG